MSPNRRVTLANLPHRVREGLVDWPARYRRWRHDLRDDPSLLWRTPVIRITLWILFGLALMFGARWLTVSLTPSGAALDFQEPTRTAILYVACANPDCRASYTTKQPMDFKDWPLKCERCGQESVYRAWLCPQCRKWVATAPGEPVECPYCVERRAADQPPPPTEAEPISPDDEEDPWG